MVKPSRTKHINRRTRTAGLLSRIRFAVLIKQENYNYYETNVTMLVINKNCCISHAVFTVHVYQQQCWMQYCL